MTDSAGNAVSTSGKSITIGAYTTSACTVSASGTLTVSPGATQTTNSSGVATFTSITYSGTSGTTVYICATDTANGYVQSAQAVTVNTGAASQLALVSPPTTVQSGIASSGAFTVQITDSGGNAISTSGISITLGAYTTNSCSVSASGTFSASSSATQSTNSSGVASFTSITYTGTTGTIYLCALDTTDGYTAGYQAVTVTAGTASQLGLISPPTTVQLGTASSPFTVQVQDSAGNAVSTSGHAITVGAYTSNSCAVAASGTFTPAPSATQSTNSSGVASFTSITYSTGGGPIYLCATDSGDNYTAAYQAVTVTGITAVQLGLISAPTTVYTGAASTSFTVQIQDSLGNAVSGSGHSITIGAYTTSSCSSSASGTFSAVLSATASTNSSGTASFTSFTYTGSTGMIYLCATDTTDGYTDAYQSVNVDANSLSFLSSSVTATPATGPIGTLFTATGEDFTTATSFSVNGTEGIIFDLTTNSMVGMVMPGTTSGLVSITTTAGGTINSTANFTVTSTGVPAVQQGSKLVGTGNTGVALQGSSLAISANGNTAIVGGYADNTSQGAAWIWTRSGTTWSQQGSKLVGTGNTGAALQGSSLAISADGNTAIVGGYGDNTSQGATWIWTRSGTTWSQQGSKLVGTGNTGAATQGISVAISADGNTAIVGGYTDNTNQGAAWIWTRSGTTWSQQGSKLVGTGNTGAAQQGFSVAISADSNTAIVGGYTDNTSQGAAWIWTRSGTTWSQQGSKLVGTGNTGAANQGRSVAISADGNTAIVGGDNDNTNEGAAWIWTRSGTTWSQQGSKLVGTGATGTTSYQGIAVTISADGNTAIVGGYGDNSNQGAVWVWTRSGTTWSQSGSKRVGTGNTGAAEQGVTVRISADGNTAIVGGNSDNTNQGAAWIWVP